MFRSGHIVYFKIIYSGNATLYINKVTIRIQNFKRRTVEMRGEVEGRGQAT